MATKKPAENVVTDASTIAFAEPITLEAIADMQSAKRQLEAKIKAAKATLPKRTPMEIVLAKQPNGVTDKRARDVAVQPELRCRSSIEARCQKTRICCPKPNACSVTSRCIQAPLPA